MMHQSLLPLQSVSEKQVLQVSPTGMVPVVPPVVLLAVVPCEAPLVVPVPLVVAPCVVPPPVVVVVLVPVVVAPWVVAAAVVLLALTVVEVEVVVATTHSPVLVSQVSPVKQAQPG